MRRQPQPTQDEGNMRVDCAYECPYAYTGRPTGMSENDEEPALYSVQQRPAETLSVAGSRDVAARAAETMSRVAGMLHMCAALICAAAAPRY